MRLIDADRLKEYLDTKYLPETKETSNSYKSFNVWIDAQPTAYDVEKVVEQLEEMFKHHSATKTVKRLVIEIVKGGGVNED